MKKSFIYSILTFGSVFVISGCGGGGGSSIETISTASNTGIGYYLDSAVAGAEYKCGTKSGVTESDGSFTFEKGKDCSFELAGVPLRSIKANELKDGVEVIEDNLTVARFLQSLDFDGNPDNGIQIEKKVLDVLKEAVKNLTDPKKALSEDLDTVVAEVESKVTEFKGRVVSQDEAFEHLSKTLAPKFKDLLAGKTFYVAGKYTEDGTLHLEEIRIQISQDVSKMNWELLKVSNGKLEKGTEDIKLDGNKLIWDDGSYILLYKKDNYILAVDYDEYGKKEGEHYLYSTKAEADKNIMN